MSFSDPRSQFMSPSQSYVVPGSDAINIWPQFSVEAEDQAPDFDQNPAPFKRARNSEERQSNSSAFPGGIARAAIPANAPANKGANNIFFKTRLCAKFKLGMCRNGENCNFAHGIEDMRQPPPNWQEMVGLRGGEEDHRPSAGSWDDDQKIIHRMKICKKFYNGEECPYGDRCNFLHEDPSRYRDDSGRFRESSAISIGTTANAGTAVGVGGPASNGDDSRGAANVNGSDPLRGVPKPVYWKTKLCNKWEQTGHCPFGEKCHFAHGFPGTPPQSALHKLQAGYGRVEPEVPNIASVSTKPQVSANDILSTAPTNVTAFNEDAQGNKKCLLKWKELKKINRIYGDWLDDLPLAHNIPSRVES